MHKCLLKIGQRTILEHQIKTLKDYDMENIFLVIGTKGDVWNQKAYELIKLDFQKAERLGEQQ